MFLPGGMESLKAPWLAKTCRKADISPSSGLIPDRSCVILAGK